MGVQWLADTTPLLRYFVVNIPSKQNCTESLSLADEFIAHNPSNDSLTASVLACDQMSLLLIQT